MLKTLAAAAIGLVALAVGVVAGFGRSEAFSAPARVVSSAPPVSPPLAISDKRLVHVDPQTLAPLPGPRVDVGSGGCASRGGGEACWSIPPWSFSPDFSRLAVVRNGRFAVRSLRLVDVAGLRVAADLRVAGGPVGALAWLGRNRLVALQEVCCSARQRLLGIDVARHRVTVRRPLWGTVLGVARTPREVVLLLAPARGVGPARLAVAGALGTVRVVRVGRIVAGVPHEVGTARTRLSIPGLAVDPARRRAFLVQPGLVAEVDLGSLAVSYHRLGRTSLLGRLHAWLEPDAQAKEGSGPTRSARWLGGGLLAVTGADEQGPRSRPAGLVLVDTPSWRAKTIDASASELAVTGDLLLASGGRTSGLVAYGLDGRRRFRLFDGWRAWVNQIYNGRAYVGIFRPDGTQAPFRVVDLTTGRAAGERTLPLPWLLVEASSGWWGP
jgi:hypothetical protein